MSSNWFISLKPPISCTTLFQFQCLGQVCFKSAVILCCSALFGLSNPRFNRRRLFRILSVHPYNSCASVFLPHSRKKCNLRLILPISIPSSHTLVSVTCFPCVCVCPLKWGEKDKKQTPVSRPVRAGLVFYCSFTTLSVCFLTVWCSRVHWLSHVVLLALAVFIPFSTVCSWILSSVSCNYLCLKVIHFSRSSDLNVSGRPRGSLFSKLAQTWTWTQG